MMGFFNEMTPTQNQMLMGLGIGLLTNNGNLSQGLGNGLLLGNQMVAKTRNALAAQTNQDIQNQLIKAQTVAALRPKTTGTWTTGQPIGEFQGTPVTMHVHSGTREVAYTIGGRTYTQEEYGQLIEGGGFIAAPGVPASIPGPTSGSEPITVSPLSTTPVVTPLVDGPGGEILLPEFLQPIPEPGGFSSSADVATRNSENAARRSASLKFQAETRTSIVGYNEAIKQLDDWIALLDKVEKANLSPQIGGPFDSTMVLGTGALQSLDIGTGEGGVASGADLRRLWEIASDEKTLEVVASGVLGVNPTDKDIEFARRVKGLTGLSPTVARIKLLEARALAVETRNGKYVGNNPAGNAPSSALVLQLNEFAETESLKPNDIVNHPDGRKFKYLGPNRWIFVE